MTTKKSDEIEFLSIRDLANGLNQGTFTSSDGFEYKGNFNEGKYDYDGNMRYTRSADFIGNEGELYNNGIERGPIKLFDPPPIKK